MKTLQIHKPEMIAMGQQMTAEQIVRFLEDFRLLHGQTHSEKSIAISIRIPESLLRLFKAQCQQQGLKYQSQMKELMRDWLKNS